MSEWRVFAAELRAPKGDVAVLLAVFALTVLVDLSVAIQVGMVLASFLFMQRMAELTNVTAVTRELRELAGDESDEASGRARSIPDGVEIFEISGSVLFWSRRDLQAHVRPDCAEAEGACHTDARRDAARFDGAARAARCCRA